ncbi:MULTISPECIES: hypothetical protein [Haloarcula]|uniref:hypothetical protein n=1 Tax=Haloarcula TaxID=2237 RepID=UPI0023EB42E5|nr:hypothetical protein [Halomicroarcula sp. XH51]
MRSLELTVDTETARSLAVEADVLGFDGIDGYLRWLVTHRLDIASDGETGQRLAEYADRVTDVEADDDLAAVAEAAVTDGTGTDDRSGVTARIQDDQLTAAADALSSVERQRLDLFAQDAIARTREQLGDGGTDEYRSDRPLVGEKPPGADITDLSAIDVPGRNDERTERRQEAVGAALAFLRSESEATRSDFVEALYEDYPAGYDSPDSWWECITQGLRQVDRVDPARRDSRVWRFRETPGRVTRISFE